MKDKNRAMGRGLGAILSAESRATVHTAGDAGAQTLVGSIVEIPLTDIYANATQPRTHFDEKALNDLAESIKNLGVIQPITLRKDGEKFEIISGERRFRASKIAGLKAIPAYIRLANDTELLEMALVENIQREDLDAIEVALTYQRLLEEVGLTQENLSRRIGKERSTITNSIRLLKLDPDVQNAIRSGVISAGHGRAILSVEDPVRQKKLFEKIISEHLSVRQSEAAAKLQEINPKKKSSSPSPESHQKIQKAVAEIFGTKVQIKSSGSKGKLIVDFKNEEELEKILSHIK